VTTATRMVDKLRPSRETLCCGSGPELVGNTGQIPSVIVVCCVAGHGVDRRPVGDDHSTPSTTTVFATMMAVSSLISLRDETAWHRYSPPRALEVAPAGA
jgi:hypothetical protein